MTTPEPLRIVHLTARHVLGLREATLDIGDGLEVHGENGSGKTSLLAALSAIAKRGGGDVQAIGEDAGEIIARLVGPGREIEVKRRVGNGVEVIESRNGLRTKLPRPQGIVEQLFADYAFDPLKFAGEKPGDQVATFCRAFPCRFDEVEGAVELAERFGVSTDGHGMEVASALEQALAAARLTARQVLDRKKKAAEDAAPARREVRYDESAHAGARQDIAAAQHELANANAEDKRREDYNRTTEEWLATAEQREADAKRLRAEAARMLEEAEACERSAKSRREDAAKRERLDPVDRADLEAKLREATDREAGFRREAEAAQAVNRWLALEEEAEQADAEWRALQETIERVRGPIRRALAEQIECGIEGLTVGPDGLSVGGVPVATLNRQRQIALGVEIAAALCKDRPVRLVAIDNAESVTESNRRALAEECKRLGMQWIFLVASEGETPAGAVRVEGGVVTTEGRP